MYLGDIVSNQESKPKDPFTAGLYRQTKGEPLVHPYKVDEMKIMLEGEFTLSDENGHKVTAKPEAFSISPKAFRLSSRLPTTVWRSMLSKGALFPPHNPRVENLAVQD